MISTKNHFFCFEYTFSDHFAGPRTASVSSPPPAAGTRVSGEFKVLATVNTNITIFYDVTPCGLV
jgi:hypothetical protein